jgi:hypothetical protein
MQLVVSNNKPLISSEINDDKFPWNMPEHGDKEFWLQRIGQYVKLTGDIDSNGFYYVKAIGGDGVREYLVNGKELILSESKEAKKIDLRNQQSGMFPINRSNWTQIKNFLTDDFINSYPWKGNESKSSEALRDNWLSAAKNPRTGIARLIENERAHGVFLDKSTFASRMKPHSDLFPWQKLSEFLDFSEPQT